MTKFIGSGGSSSKAATATITPDNLFSNDQIEIILGLCVGPIKGLAEGSKSFYIGNTQYQNIDGTYNFDLFDVEINPGNTPGELITPTLGGYEDWNPNELSLPYNTLVYTPTITADYNQLVVRIRIAELFRGGIDPTLSALPGAGSVYNGYLPNTLTINVRYASAGGSYINPFGGPLEFHGKTVTDEFHEIRFPVTGHGPYSIELNCLTDNLHLAPCVVYYEGYYGVSGGLFGLVRSDTINTQLTYGIPIIRTTDIPNQRPDGTYGIDFIGFRFVVSTLYEEDTTGTHNAYCQWQVDYKATSSPTWIALYGGPLTIYGKTSGQPYVYEGRFPVLPINDTYDVRVTLVTAPTSNTTLVTSWESMQEIVGGPIKFDGVATAHIVGTSTASFSGLPDLWGIYDLKLCSIPSNYDPYARTFTGTWDGTFKIDWTSNPAWCLYDLCMSSTDGIRAYWPNFSLNKWDIYNAGVWCDGLVPDGQGGQQPRYTFNGLISEPRGIGEQARYMAGVFNGTFLEDMNGNTRVVFDNDAPACAVFTPENVTSEGFSYAYTDLGTRYNQVTAQFNDPNLLYQVNQVVEQDDAHIAKYGLIPLSFAAIGCTNAHEARRRAAYKLLSATTEVEIVSFRTNRQGTLLTPLSIILVADPDMGNGLTGRIKSLDATRQVVYLRDPVYLETGVVYYFQTQCRNPNYPNIVTGEPATITVSIPFYAPINGQTIAFELHSPLPPEVQDNAAFSLGSESNIIGIPKAYRITKIEETAGSLDNITIEAIEINRNKLFLADNVANTTSLDYLYLPAAIAPPTGLQISTQVVQIDGVNIANVVATWVRSTDPRVSYTTIDYRLSGETTWLPMGQFKGERGDLYNIPNGVYDFRAQSVAPGPRYSIYTTVAASAQGLDLPPPDVAGVSITVVGDTLNLAWNSVHATNLSHYWVRFNPTAPGPSVSWENSTDLLINVVANHASVPTVPGTYFVKAVTTSGQVSVNAGFASTTSSGLNRLITLTEAQQPTWAGTKANYTINASGELVSDPTQGSPPGVAGYQFASDDLGAVYTVHISMSTKASSQLLGNVMSTWTTLAAQQSLSGTTPNDYNIFFSIETSQDGTTWSTLVPFATGDWVGRRFRFTLNTSINKPNVSVTVYQLQAVLSFYAKTQVGSNLFVPTSGANISFAPPFRNIPIITITPKELVSGDYYQITNQFSTGFTVKFFNNSGTPITHTIDWSALGYGGGL